VTDTTLCSSGGTPDPITATLTPAANDLLVVFTYSANDTDQGSVTDDQGGTYAEIRSATSGGITDRMAVWVRTSLANNVSTVVSYDADTTDGGSGCTLIVLRVAGMSKTGASAVRQHNGESDRAGGGTPSGAAFASPVLTGNVTLGYVTNGTSPATLTEPTGWTFTPE
jgi:hypothetical protein